MHFKFLSILGVTSLATAFVNAPVTHDNNPHVKYRAHLPGSKTTPIRGAISGHSSNNGTGIVFNVEFTGFPAEGGPYLYHIHESRVPADGNCTGTGAHLDPYSRGETPACDATQPATCQLGDLSGKHGKPVSGNFTAKYRDLYLSTIAGSAAFFGNRSVVIHNKDKVRLTCANFEIAPDTNSTTSATATGTGVGSAPTATGSPIVTGAAASVKTSGLGAGLALLAVLGLML